MKVEAFLALPTPWSCVRWMICRCRFETLTRVVVDDPERAHARRRQIGDSRAAEAARAHDQDARGLELLLTFAPDVPQARGGGRSVWSRRGSAWR